MKVSKHTIDLLAEARRLYRLADASMYSDTNGLLHLAGISTSAVEQLYYYDTPCRDLPGFASVSELIDMVGPVKLSQDQYDEYACIEMSLGDTKAMCLVNKELPGLHDLQWLSSLEENAAVNSHDGDGDAKQPALDM